MTGSGDEESLGLRTLNLTLSANEALGVRVSKGKATRCAIVSQQTRLDIVLSEFALEESVALEEDLNGRRERRAKGGRVKGS